MNEEQLFISPLEASQILGVNKRTVMRMIKQGKIRAKDLNASSGIRKQWVVLKEDILKTDNAK